MTAFAVQAHSVVERGPRDFDALLNGRFIGNFPNANLAWAELTQIDAYEKQVEGGCDPTAMFGAKALPSVSVSVSDDEIKASYAAFRTVYTATDRIGKMVDKAFNEVVRRRDQWKHSSDGGIVVIGSPPRKGADPSEYTVKLTDEGHTCGCGSLAYFAWVQGHMCKHIIAIEMVRMAQAARPAEASNLQAPDPSHHSVFQPIGSPELLTPPPLPDVQVAAVAEAVPDGDVDVKNDATVEFTLRRLTQACELLIDEMVIHDAGDAVTWAFTEDQLILGCGSFALRYKLDGFGHATTSISAIAMICLLQRMRQIQATEQQVMIQISNDTLSVSTTTTELRIDDGEQTVVCSINPNHVCGNNHPVARDQLFCPQCGSNIQRETLPANAEIGDLCAIRPHGKKDRRVFRFSGSRWEAFIHAA